MIGVVDGSHIPIKCPREYKEQFFNRKLFFSFNNQGIVSADQLFIDLLPGLPGSIHDAHMFHLSKACRMLLNGQWLDGPQAEFAGTQVPQVKCRDACLQISCFWSFGLGHLFLSKTAAPSCADTALQLRLPQHSADSMHLQIVCCRRPSGECQEA